MVEVKFAQGMQRAKQGVCIGFDSWTDVSHTQLMAISVTTSEQPRQVSQHELWSAAQPFCMSADILSR